MKTPVEFDTVDYESVWFRAQVRGRPKKAQLRD